MTQKKHALFFFHVSHETRTTALFLRTVLNGFWLQRVARSFESLFFFFFFFHIREEATGAIERKQAEDCLESETHFKGFPQKPDCEI